jgi:hypothetical protein
VALVPLHLKVDRRGLGGVPLRPDKPLVAPASSSPSGASLAAPALPSLSDQSIADFRERIAHSRDAARMRYDRNQCARILGALDEEAEQADTVESSQVHVGADAGRDEHVDEDSEDKPIANAKRHKRAVLSHVEAEAPASAAEAEPESDEQVHAALLHLLARLRAKHRYCIYCATRFASDDEMRVACPGALRADH